MRQLPAWLLRMTEQRLAVIVTLLLLLPLARPGCTTRFEDTTLRAGVALSTGVARPPEVVIAAIDERAIDEMGPLPWPRATLARALDRLSTLAAKAVAVETGVVRSSMAPEGRVQVQREESGMVVAGYEFYTSLADLPRGAEALSAEARGAAAVADLALPQAPADDSPMVAMAGVDLATLPPPGLRVTRQGFANLFPDADGILRRQPLAVRLRHRAFPSLALATAAAARGFTPLIDEDAAGKPSGVTIGDRTIPTAPDAGIAIRFRGNSGSIPSASITDLVEGRLPAETVLGRIVLVGVTDPREAPLVSTPVGAMPAIEFTASTLDTLLVGEPIQPLTSRHWLAIFIAVAGLTFAVAGVRLAAFPRIAWSLAAIAATWGAAIALFAGPGIQIPAVHLTIAIATLLLVTLLFRFVRLLPQRARVAPYRMRLSDKALAAARNDPSAFDRRGRGRQLAACAIDIRGFGAVTQPLAPDRLCSIVRIYRTIVTDALLPHGAFIESWAGDECRAAFGAPAPHATPALAACQAAFASLRAMAHAREEIERRYGVPKLRLGIGIASGTAAAGDLGPRGAESFGIVGSAMEAAVMLRALNRAWRTAVIVDERTRVAAEAAFAFRPLDLVMLAGEPHPVPIHELLGETGVILPQLDLYLAGREAYLRADFDTAIHLFSKVLAQHPHDGPAALLLARSRELRSRPPRSEWRGVYGAS